MNKAEALPASSASISNNLGPPIEAYSKTWLQRFHEKNRWRRDNEENFSVVVFLSEWMYGESVRSSALLARKKKYPLGEKPVRLMVLLAVGWFCLPCRLAYTGFNKIKSIIWYGE